MYPALFALIGYLCGSFPTGVVIGRFVGADPRKVGSGNIGATNVVRAMGKKWGLLTLLIDAAKGALPALVGGLVDGPQTAAIAAIASVLGHCYPVWLRFKGGKGVATAFGTFLVFSPAVAVVGAVIFAVVVFVTRIPALGSLTAAATMVPLTRMSGAPFEVQAYSIVVFLLLVLRHESNLRALKKRWVRDAERRARRSGTRGKKKRRR